MPLTNKKASCALPELTYSTGICSLSHNPKIAGLCSKTGGDHLDNLTHLNIAHPGWREAMGPCRICVSARGMNLYLVSHIVVQCLTFLCYYSFVAQKNQD